MSPKLSIEYCVPEITVPEITEIKLKFTGDQKMGLYISHLDTITIKQERALYIYLLDYGWPEGEWERIFKKHFMKLADMASDSEAVVIASPRGVHFGNEVLNWHRVGSLDSNRVLPGLLITKTHPSYFSESNSECAPARPGLEDLMVIPLRDVCRDETDFKLRGHNTEPCPWPVGFTSLPEESISA